MFPERRRREERVDTKRTNGRSGDVETDKQRWRGQGPDNRKKVEVVRVGGKIS